MPTWLITGASGFLGRHLIRRLWADRPPDVELVGVGRNIPGSLPAGSFRRVDLGDRASLSGLIGESSPTVVFHLGGQTPPGEPSGFYRGNTLATVNLLDSLRESGRPCRVVLVGSAAELGPVPIEQLPVGERWPCRPADSYGLSKWLATCAGLAASPPLEVVVARVFNLIGPGMPNSQALGRFAEELACGDGPVCLRVGDIEAKRDFIDARDVAGALIALASRGRPGRIYHVGSGQSRRIGEGLDRLIALSGREVVVEVDPALARRRGPEDSRADIRRIASEAGWTPEIDWERSLRDVWDEAIVRSRAGLTGGRPFV